jgi:hypothetical protein
MLESLDSPTSTHGGENLAAESISRKDVCAAYLAGVMDGEGCIHARFGRQTNPRYRGGNTLRIGVTIYNTHHALVRRVTECLTFLEVPFSMSATGRKNNEKPGVNVVVEGKGRTAKLLNILLPYLSAKKMQAVLALELIAYRESLAVKLPGLKGRFGKANLQEDEKILSLIRQIKREKSDFPSILEFSRLPNRVLGESSTTLRSPWETILP